MDVVAALIADAEAAVLVEPGDVRSTTQLRPILPVEVDAAAFAARDPVPAFR